MTVQILPDVERVISAYLRDHEDIEALVGARVYTVAPANLGEQPFVLLRRFGGPPVIKRPLVLDAALLQIDCYGGPKSAAHTLGRTVQAVLAECEGTLYELDDDETEVPVAVVTTVQVGAFRWLPDEVFSPPRPRYVLDAEAFVKNPGGVTVG